MNTHAGLSQPGTQQCAEILQVQVVRGRVASQ